MADTASIIAEVAAQLQDSAFWQRYLATVQPRFHIVILREPYLSLIHGFLQNCQNSQNW